MTKVTMKLRGAKELREALQRLPFREARSAIAKSIITEAAIPIRDAARALAPVETGRLREAIIVSRKLSRSQRTTFAEKGDVKVHVGVRAGVPQGVLQEFGTAHHAPHPFLRPAWDAHEGELVAKIGAAIWKAIEKRLKRRGLTAGPAVALDTVEE